MAAAATVAGKSVLAAALMGRMVHNAASAIARFIGVKVVEALFTAPRDRAIVSVVRIETVVHVSVETMRAVEPGAGADEESADKPVRTVVAVGSAVVGCVIKVPIGAHGRDANADRDLGGAQSCTAEQRNREN
jgi:hypothetical protein